MVVTLLHAVGKHCLQTLQSPLAELTVDDNVDPDFAGADQINVDASFRQAAERANGHLRVAS